MLNCDQRQKPVSTTKILFATLMITTQLGCCATACFGKTVKPPVVRVPIFFASDRKVIDSNKIEGGRELAPLWTGKSEVIVPAENEWLNADHDKLADGVAKLGWALDLTAKTQQPFIEARGYVAEYNMKPLCLPKEAQKLDETTFYSEVKNSALNSSKNNVCVYIPGFASSGDNTLYAAGILSAHTEAPVIAFSWPSEGTVGLRPPTLIGDASPKARFARDKDMIDRPQVLQDLKTVVAQLRKTLDPSTKIFLVAHSLGNRLLMNYFISDPAEVVDGAFFIAADVQESQFEKALPFLQKKSKYNAVFQNPSDLVLKASFMNTLSPWNAQRRLGDTPLEVPHIEFIDYSKVAEPNGLKYRWLRHYLPFEQFGSILRTGQPYNLPEKKAPLVMVRTTKIQPEEKFRK